MYKLIVSDLDESLLNDHGEISEADVQTIRQLTAMGVKFVPNSGRGFASMRSLLEKIGTYGQPNQYVVSYNGGVIVDNEHYNVLVNHYLDHQVADQLYQLARLEPQLGIHVYTLNEVYVTNINADERAYIQSRKVIPRELNDPTLARFKNIPIVKIIMENLDQQVLTDFRQKAIEKVSAPMTIAYSSSRYVEFNPPTVDKGRATIELGARLGIETDEIIALGDNFNDLPMIKAAGMGVSVQNGIAEVKQAANLVLDANNNQSPITELYQRLFAH